MEDNFDLVSILCSSLNAFREVTISVRFPPRENSILKQRYR